jgi:uncharacterized protein
MDFWSVAEPPVDALCFAIVGRADGAVSGCSRDTQAPRPRFGTASKSQGRFRAPAAPRRSQKRRGIHVLPRLPGKRGAAARSTGNAEAFAPGSGAQLPQALHPRGVPSIAGEPRRSGSARETALRSEGLAGDGSPPSATIRQTENMIARFLVCLLSAYRFFASPLLPSACRFHPSCSCYAGEALVRHGAWRGSWLTLRRLSRCGPWHPGGYDPVP